MVLFQNYLHLCIDVQVYIIVQRVNSRLCRLNTHDSLPAVALSVVILSRASVVVKQERGGGIHSFTDDDDDIFLMMMFIVNFRAAAPDNKNYPSPFPLPLTLTLAPSSTSSLLSPVLCSPPPPR